MDQAQWVTPFLARTGTRRLSLIFVSSDFSRAAADDHFTRQGSPSLLLTRPLLTHDTRR